MKGHKVRSRKKQGKLRQYSDYPEEMALPAVRQSIESLIASGGDILTTPIHSSLHNPIPSMPDGSQLKYSLQSPSKSRRGGDSSVRNSNKYGSQNSAIRLVGAMKPQQEKGAIGMVSEITSQFFSSTKIKQS